MNESSIDQYCSQKLINEVIGVIDMDHFRLMMSQEYDSYDLCDEATLIEIVRDDGMNLRFMNGRQSYDVCLAAVIQNGLSLQYVPENLKTPEIYFLALNQNGLALEFVLYQSVALCLVAVNQNGLALRYVFEKVMSDVICFVAVNQNGLALEHVGDQSDCLCTIAVKNDPYALIYVKKAWMTNDVRYAAFQKLVDDDNAVRVVSNLKCPFMHHHMSRFLSV